MEEVVIVMTNVPDADTARRLADALVTGRLASCVNILPEVQSVYVWRGAIEHATEITLSIKTTASRYSEVETTIAAHHPYAVPEIIAIPVVAGLPPYLAWVQEETRKNVHT